MGIGMISLVSPCARGTRHTSKRGVKAVDLLCSPNAHTEWERKDTHIAPVLPECARGTNRIVKSREGLPPRGHLERHAYPSREAQQASLKGPLMRRCSLGQSAGRREIDCDQSVGGRVKE